MPTAAELEAFIVANPGDVDGYLVYGDWLQMRGDPRGELIALQAAVQRDPEDKKLEHRTARYLDKHADELMGPLRAWRGDTLALSWHCGFIHDARIAASGDPLLAILGDLIDHPSGRFISSLTFLHETPIEPIVELLLARRRPETLVELRVRGLGDADVERLRAVFPRLHHSLAVEWRRVLDELAAQRKLEVRLDAPALPALEPVDETLPAIPVAQILLGLRLELDKGRGPGMVDILERTYTADSLDRFVVAMGKQHVAHGGATTRWVWRAVGALGRRHAAGWIGDSVFGWQYRALHAVDVLGDIGSEHAILELASIAFDPRHERDVRAQARNRLQSLAAARGIGVEDLIDRSIPADPAPRGRDAIERRLLAQMIDGRRINATTFRHHVATHPTLAPLAARLVWAVYDGPSVRTMFRLAGERPVGVDGDPVELGDRIGILHPAELPTDRREEIGEHWRRVFETLGISPPFPQLDRPVYALAEHESGSELLRFADRSVGIDRLRAVLEHQRDWDQRVAYPRSEGWSRRFTRTQVTVFADSDNIAITRVRAVSTATGEPVRFATLDPITTSELLYDLETATTEPVAVNTETPIDRGTRVRIVRGADRGKHGVVFWLDEPPATRCGIRGDDGDTYWASLVMVVLEGVADPTDTEPWFDRGMRVRWTKAKQTGTGTVFWIGKNKFGDGMRVGIKDDASGETVWASAKDCAHEDAPRAD